MLMNENVLEMTSKPSKTSSQWNSSVGNIKEITGGMLGSKSLFKAGQKQRSDAEFSRRQAQFQNYGDGLIDGFKAKAQNVSAAALGNKQDQIKAMKSEEKANKKRSFA